MELHLTPGLSGEKHDHVTGANTALAYGSGTVEVYATPAMVGLMEGAAIAALDAHLPAGYSSVGTEIHVRHTAATPIGMAVRATAKLFQIDGRRLVFRLEAFDEREQIGSGTHERFIVQLDKFLAKANGK